MFWWPVSEVEVLKVGALDVRFKPFTFQGEDGSLSSLPIVCHHAGGGVYHKIILSQPLLLILMWVFFLSRHVGVVQVVSGFLSERNIPYEVVD